MRPHFLLTVAILLAAQWISCPGIQVCSDMHAGPLLAHAQELWEAFNGMVKDAVRNYVLLRLSDANVPVDPRENADVSRGIRRVLQVEDLSPLLQLAYSIMVWDRILPPDYQDLLHGYVDGVVEYDRCFSRPLEPAHNRHYAPCGEGGSILIEASVTPSRAKVIMVFYTPEGSRAMVLHPSSGGVSGVFRRRGPLSRALTHAAETCSNFLRAVPFDAQSYADCLELETRSQELGHPQYTALRGVAVVPEVPYTDSYSPPDYLSSRGFVLIDQLQWEPSMDDLTQQIRLMLVKLWLYIGTPVVIP